MMQVYSKNFAMERVLFRVKKRPVQLLRVYVHGSRVVFLGYFFIQLMQDLLRTNHFFRLNLIFLYPH